MWNISLTGLLLLSISCVIGQRDRVDIKDKSLTIDKIMLLALGGTNRMVNSFTMPDPDRQLVELDMVLTQKQKESLYGSPGRTKRKAVSDETVYWPNGRVPYKFAPGHFNEYEQWMLKVSMREYEKYTCLRFHEATSSDTNHVYFQDGFGCNSQLGMVGGRQILNLDKAGCRFKGLYLHEIAHALGVVHEHQRPIRDKYISIVYDNVEDHMKIWFNKYQESAINSHDVDYEYSSVMHYGITAFSKNDGTLQTIRALNKSRESEIGRVYAKEMSFTDIEIVNRMYGCVKSPQECSGKRCNGKGYLDQNCNCICPDGSQDCTVGKEIDTSCQNTGDIRDSWLCYIWARQGECERNPGYMESNCAKACGKCGDEREELTGTNLCEDVYDTCEKWRDEIGDCRVAEPFMKKYCKKACGYCNDFVLDRISPRTQCANAYEDDQKCEEWARKGECIINERWMPLNCRKACFTCEFNDQTPITVTPSGSTLSTQQPVTTRRPPITTRPPIITTRPTTRKPTDECVNTWESSTDCEIWAKHDHCSINPGFMLSNCMRSCGICDGGDEMFEGCEDTHPNPGPGANCPVWAEGQQCVINPGYMLKYCKKSCKRCTRDLQQAAKEVVSRLDAEEKENNNNNGSRPVVVMSSIVTILAVFLFL